MGMVGGWAYPFEKYEFVTWDDYSQIFPVCGKIKVMFQTKQIEETQQKHINLQEILHKP